MSRTRTGSWSSWPWKSPGNRRRGNGRLGRPPEPSKDSSMPISRADVEHVARLARLALTDEELDRFQAQLSVILEEALSTAPEIEQDRFKVPRIIEEAP